MWETPYEPGHPDYTTIGLFFLEPAGQFGLMIAPSVPAKKRSKGKLPVHVIWPAGDQGIVRSVNLSDLPAAKFDSGESKLVMGTVIPPPLLAEFPGQPFKAC